MKNLKELEEYIESQAKEHAEEDSLYEMLEVDTYVEIIIFCLNEGVTINQIDPAIYLTGIYDENEETGEKDFWYYYCGFMEFVENSEGKNEIPSYVKHLHDFYHKAFWPDYGI